MNTYRCRHEEKLVSRASQAPHFLSPKGNALSLFNLAHARIVWPYSTYRALIAPFYRCLLLIIENGQPFSIFPKRVFSFYTRIYRRTLSSIRTAIPRCQGHGTILVSAFVCLFTVIEAVVRNHLVRCYMICIFYSSPYLPCSGS